MLGHGHAGVVRRERGRRLAEIGARLGFVHRGRPPGRAWRADHGSGFARCLRPRGRRGPGVALASVAQGHPRRGTTARSTPGGTPCFRAAGACALKTADENRRCPSEPRDQHVLAGTDTARFVRIRRTGVRRRGATRRRAARAQALAHSLKPSKRAATRSRYRSVRSRTRAAGLPARPMNGWPAHLRRGARRLRCDPARSARRDGHAAIDDGEGELLRRIRAIAPDTPLAVALDLHGNITQAMVDHADVMVGFKTYPHIDMFETGAHAARTLFTGIDSGRKPAMAWARAPLLSHTLRSTTGEGAMQRAIERAKRMEAEGLPAATFRRLLAGGHPGCGHEHRDGRIDAG